MRLFYFGMWLGAVLWLALGAAGLGSVLWPVTVYELFDVAEGPFAPGHPGKAYLPREREPNFEEIQARLRILVPGLAGVAAVVFAWRVARGPSRSEPLVTLEAWNTAGLDVAKSPSLPHAAKATLNPRINPPIGGA